MNSKPPAEIPPAKLPGRRHGKEFLALRPDGQKVAKKAAPKVGKPLPIVVDVVEETALSARWPEPVLLLPDEERAKRVRVGVDSVLLDDVKADGSPVIRGFVRVVLRVPLSSPRARVYGVFVEVDRASYVALQKAFHLKVPTRVRGRLATRLPFLDDAYGTDVEVEEDGSDARARVVAAVSPSLNNGPQVGPRGRTPSKS